ncbi:hypothetical protein DB31_6627 [Hyalangium minutum]|uniref:Uncharacterized protein n=1 Tax=Hyalangium minutum TaxID=394096 RepID=A0A085WPN9_9BACT|nr:hypothetical protein DB31_6627 [Hyalangium minutum]
MFSPRTGNRQLRSRPWLPVPRLVKGYLIVPVLPLQCTEEGRV